MISRRNVKITVGCGDPGCPLAKSCAVEISVQVTHDYTVALAGRQSRRNVRDFGKDDKRFVVLQRPCPDTDRSH